MLNVRQPGSFTDAAPFSLIASMNFGMSAGLISRKTALMKRPPACAATSRAESCNSAAPASTSARAERNARIGLFIVFLPSFVGPARYSIPEAGTLSGGRLPS
jgi:hypothetical protein